MFTKRAVIYFSGALQTKFPSFALKRNRIPPFTHEKKVIIYTSLLTLLSILTRKKIRCHFPTLSHTVVPTFQNITTYVCAMTFNSLIYAGSYIIRTSFKMHVRAIRQNFYVRNTMKYPNTYTIFHAAIDINQAAPTYCISFGYVR